MITYQIRKVGGKWHVWLIQKERKASFDSKDEAQEWVDKEKKK